MERRFSKVKYIAQMIVAFFCAFFLVNVVCYFYHNRVRTVANLDRYTFVKLEARRKNYWGLEGYGITSTDENGFFNDGKVPPEKAGVLCIGSSHTEALQVDSSLNYVSQLNKLNPKYNAYNLGISGQFANKTLYRLPFIPNSFPACKVIVCETPNLPTLKDWDEIIQLLEMNDDVPIKNEQNWRSRLYHSVPYLGLIHYNLQKILPQRKDTNNKVFSDMEQYRQKANTAMQLLREQLGEIPLVIVYLPRLRIEKNGHITITNNDERQRILKEGCEANNILYVYNQLSSIFIENYESRRVLPYGFLNSHIGQGHLNAEGHNMVAEVLHRILREEGFGK